MTKKTCISRLVENDSVRWDIYTEYSPVTGYRLVLRPSAIPAGVCGMPWLTCARDVSDGRAANISKPCCGKHIVMYVPTVLPFRMSGPPSRSAYVCKSSRFIVCRTLYVCLPFIKIVVSDILVGMHCAQLLESLCKKSKGVLC